jgi:hypothetical protein
MLACAPPHFASESLIKSSWHAGFWLAMKAASPIYIKRSVWDECATEIETDGGGTLDDALKNFRAIRCAPARNKCM